MNKLSLSLSCFVIIVVFLTSCSNSPESRKKAIRENWGDHFKSYLDYHGKDSKLGTDSTKIVFENNSDYTVDSAIFLFENQGLLVHSYDTVRCNIVLSHSKKIIPAPVHKLGWTHLVHIFAIYSKALEFHYHADLPEEKKSGDCYYCQAK
ncbi:hypothetical protein BH09BAC5_BH09BAC5_24280 [soil metagenome]